MLPIEKHILWHFFEPFANVSLIFEFVDPEKIAKNSSKFVDRSSKKPHDNLAVLGCFCFASALSGGLWVDSVSMTQRKYQRN